MKLKITENDFDKDVYDYCNDILSGTILSGLYTKKAIERFIREYTKQQEGNYEYIFIPKLANEVINFAESLFIPDIDKKLQLLPWHKFIYYNLYGWVHKNDTSKKRFRSGYVECARKNSKTSSLLFPIILWDFRQTKAAESFFVSKSEKQVQKTFQEMKMILQETFNIDKRKIVMTESGIRKDDSFIKFFSSGSRDIDQYKNSCSVIDEYHDFDNKGEKIVTSFRYGSRARKNSLLFIITSAGTDIAGPCYAECEKAKKLLNCVINDDTYFTIIYAYDANDDWKNPDNFIKANPSLGSIIKKEILEIDLNDALITPSHEMEFKSKTCGLWNSGGTRSWIPIDKWQSLDQGPIDWNEFIDIPCYASFDLSSILDFTCFTLCFFRGDSYYFKHRFYVPSETIINRYKQENVGIYNWIRNGIINVIQGPTVDYSCVFEDIKNDMQTFKIQEISYDPWNSRELIKMIEDEFSSKIVVVPYYQNLRSLNLPTKQYEKLVFERKIVDPNPIMTWMVSNVEIKPDVNGNYKPLKDFKSSTKRIDGVITSIIALDRNIANSNVSENAITFEELMGLF
jgi:phage terminase large subunit-like protein